MLNFGRKVSTSLIHKPLNLSPRLFIPIHSRTIQSPHLSTSASRQQSSHQTNTCSKSNREINLNAKMITGPLNEMLARNSKIAETYQAPPPLAKMVEGMRATGQGVVVLSCSDPRLNPYQILGIDPSLKATMVRNAGGRAFDAVRTLAVLQTIGAPGTIVVMHHTDCGMTHYHDDKIREALIEIAPEEKISISKMKFGEILNIEDSIKEDLALLRSSPLIKKTTQLVGLKWDIFTGILTQID